MEHTNTGSIGVWTPIAIPTSGSIDFLVYNGRYSKIGQQVLATFDIEVAKITGSSSTTVKLGGLPFTSVTDAGVYTGAVTFSYFSGMNVPIDSMCGTVANSSTSVELWYKSSQEQNLIKMTQNVLNVGSRLVGIANYLAT